MKALGSRSVASIVKVGLDIVWYVLWIAAAVLALAAVAYTAAAIGVAAGWLQVEGGDEGYAQVGPITIEGLTGEPGLSGLFTWYVVLTAFLAGGVIVGGGLVVVGRLKRLFASFTGGEPFSADNARHLRMIWIALLVIELSRYAIAGSVWLLLTAFGQPQDVEMSVRAPINLTAWGAILVLIVLAEVFREGARLREAEKLTI